MSVMSAIGSTVAVEIIVFGEPCPTWAQLFLLSVLAANLWLMWRAIRMACSWARWVRYLT